VPAPAQKKGRSSCLVPYLIGMVALVLLLGLGLAAWAFLPIRASQSQAPTPAISTGATPAGGMLPTEAPPAETPAEEPAGAANCDEELLASNFGSLYRENAQMQERLGCPTESPQSVSLFAQSFEMGNMYWQEAANVAIVLVGDGSGEYLRYTQDDIDALPPQRGERALLPHEVAFRRIYNSVPEMKEVLGDRTDRIPKLQNAVFQPFETGAMLFIETYRDTGQTVIALSQTDNTFTSYPVAELPVPMTGETPTPTPEPSPTPTPEPSLTPELPPPPPEGSPPPPPPEGSPPPPPPDESPPPPPPEGSPPPPPPDRPPPRP
jgi:hypothetical protein